MKGYVTQADKLQTVALLAQGTFTRDNDGGKDEYQIWPWDQAKVVRAEVYITYSFIWTVV